VGIVVGISVQGGESAARLNTSFASVISTFSPTKFHLRIRLKQASIITSIVGEMNQDASGDAFSRNVSPLFPLFYGYLRSLIMSDNVSNRQSNRSTFSVVEEAGELADPRSADTRIRREFLRRLAMTGIAIPVIGTTTLAGDQKRKQKEKEKESHSSSSSGASSGGAKAKTSQASASARRTQGTSSAQTVDRPAMTDAENAATNPGKPLPELYKKWNIDIFTQIQADENAHVAFLVNALGAFARPMPIFQGLEQSKVHEFAEVSRALENTGVGAYLGALPVLASTQLGQQYLAAAGSIALIEARHAGYLNTLLDLNIVENITGNVSSFDVPLTPQQVVTNASPFIASLNGGPPLIPAGGLTNAIDILNFALALEYLEAAFYNINVPELDKVLRR
jgi:Ferritin-like domain